MSEEEQLLMGSYCHTLMEDPQFNNLVKVCVQSFSSGILEEEDKHEREKLYYTYQGLKSLLELMQQFVINRDQIVANREQDEEKEKDKK